MDIKDFKDRFKEKPKKSPYLHSANHLLADELSQKMNEPKRFGFYLRIAGKYDHNVLRRLAAHVLESSSTKKPGALFAYLVKKEFTPPTSSENNDIKSN